uniref:Uncharacterized protein n=1 Tax=Setaria digitata TaxID=48799 RepID=A0A915Q2L9_9BILA
MMEKKAVLLLQQQQQSISSHSPPTHRLGQLQQQQTLFCYLKQKEDSIQAAYNDHYVPVYRDTFPCTLMPEKRRGEDCQVDITVVVHKGHKLLLHNGSFSKAKERQQNNAYVLNHDLHKYSAFYIRATCTYIRNAGAAVFAGEQPTRRVMKENKREGWEDALRSMRVHTLNTHPDFNVMEKSPNRERERERAAEQQPDDELVPGGTTRY